MKISLLPPHAHLKPTLEHLAIRNFNETNVANDYNIKWDVIENLASKGMVKVFIAEEGDTIVGYIAFMFSEGFFSNEKCAETFAMYVLPEYRSKWVFPKMLKVAEEEMKRCGVVRSYVVKRVPSSGGNKYSMLEIKYSKEIV